MLRRWLVVGDTAWGLTLAWHLAHRGHTVSVLCRSAADAEQLSVHRTHPNRAPLVRLPASVQALARLDAIAPMDAVLCAVPAQTMRANVRQIAPMLGLASVVVSAAKGIDVETGLRMSEVIAAETAGRHAVVAISGPNLADEVARSLPATLVAASACAPAAAAVQAALGSPLLRVYTHHDIVGVELGGALKNIIALGAGIGDGLGSGDNAKAAFMTRGLAEITRLGVALGADPLTFAGLSGLGDLIATCAGNLSRNHRVGYALGKGEALPAVLARLGHVAEGIPTTRAALTLAARLDVSMPITEALARVLFEGVPAAVAAQQLMERHPRAELPL